MFSARFKHKIRKVIPFGIIWAIFGFLYAIMERGILGDSSHYPSSGNPYDFSSSLFSITIGGMVIGLVVGIMDVFVFKKVFKEKSFTQKLVLGIVFYVLIISVILFLMAFPSNNTQLDTPLLATSSSAGTFNFMTHFIYESLLAYMGILVVLSIFFSEVSENLGKNALSNFFTGKYHSPKEEERVFMFLDMKASTAIAERIGHHDYFRLVQEYYSDISEAIIETEGEIYQYVGDEIIVTWPLKKGIQNNRCVECFFIARDNFMNQREKYMRLFESAPTFKAGLHYGLVTTGEVGVIKKEILFTGDVLSTTARIQESCNGMGVDNLISENLLRLLDLGEAYSMKKMGICKLRGKNKPISLYHLSKEQVQL